MAAPAFWTDEQARTHEADVEACRREIARLETRRRSPEVLRKLGVELKWLARMTGRAA